MMIATTDNKNRMPNSDLSKKSSVMDSVDLFIVIYRFYILIGQKKMNLSLLINNSPQRW